MNKKNKFRSSNWYNSKSHRRDTFIHRGWMRNQGHPNHLFDGRPVIGICNTWSELTPCNGHFREIAESVKKGVYEAGGFPLEFPVFSASESNLRPFNIVVLERPAPYAAFFDINLVHGCYPNVSDRTRFSLAWEYIPTSETGPFVTDEPWCDRNTVG